MRRLMSRKKSWGYGNGENADYTCPLQSFFSIGEPSDKLTTRSDSYSTPHNANFS